MEGAAFAQVCFLCNVPFVVIRGLSDTPNGNNTIDFRTYLGMVSKQVGTITNKLLDII
jgi:adenosylhomocysteine nucleosidase